MMPPPALQTPHNQRAIFGLFGAGGFGREVMPFAKAATRHLLQNRPALELDICFIETDGHKRHVHGVPVHAQNDFLALEHPQKLFNIAISDSQARQAIAQQLMDKGATPCTLQSPHAIIYAENTLGQGAIICAHTTITSNVTIGQFFHLNLYSYVAHDCVIGDYVTFAPNVHCNGNVHIESHAYIGAGAILKQGTPAKPLRIGQGAIVGMGAVVTKDVPPYTTVVGNPARPLHQPRA